MATVHITLEAVNGRAITGATLQLPDSVPLDKDTITSSATSQPASISEEPVAGVQQWQIAVTGGNVWAKFGDSPEAAEGDDRLLLDGSTYAFAVKTDGEGVAIIDA